MTHEEFFYWLINQKPLTIIFEACGTSNYWKQKVVYAGHDARLISARLVSVVRQNQKTDKNDALAIVQATFLPDVTYIGGKTVDQQQLQSIKRLRELTVKQQGASQKQLVALLLAPLMQYWKMRLIICQSNVEKQFLLPKGIWPY